MFTVRLYQEYTLLSSLTQLRPQWSKYVTDKLHCSVTFLLVTTQGTTCWKLGSVVFQSGCWTVHLNSFYSHQTKEHVIMVCTHAQRQIHACTAALVKEQHGDTTQGATHSTGNIIDNNSGCSTSVIHWQQRSILQNRKHTHARSTHGCTHIYCSSMLHWQDIPFLALQCPKSEICM